MPKKKTTRILALDPGTRYLGYAVLEGEDLLYHGVKVLPFQRGIGDSCRAAKRAVEEIIDNLQPSVLAIEHSFFGKSAQLAKQVKLVQDLVKLGRDLGIETVAYAPNTVRKFLCGHGFATKRDVAHMVTLRYPELRAYIVREWQWKERFHGHMFDAVATGLYALSRR